MPAGKTQISIKDGSATSRTISQWSSDGSPTGNLTGLMHSEDGEIETLGSKADSAYSDATGAAAGSLVALLKAIFVAAKAALPAGTNKIGGVTIANGDNATQGAIADAAYADATGAASGSLVALLKGLFVASKAALPAGANIIGKIGIDQTTDGSTNKVSIDASLKSSTATRTAVPSVVSTGTILAANASRKGATIYNSDANALLLDLSGGTASSSRCQIRLQTGQSYEVGAGFTGTITGIWEADGAGQADVVEFT